MVSVELSYYYGYESEQFSFYRIPKLLFTDSRFANPWTGTVICGQCGSIFKRKKCRESAYWTCRLHDKSPDKCQITQIPESEFERAFLRLYYKLRHHGMPVLSQLLTDPDASEPSCPAPGAYCLRPDRNGGPGREQETETGAGGSSPIPACRWRADQEYGASAGGTQAQRHWGGGI